MTDYELAQRIQEYRNRLDALMAKASQFLSAGTGNRKDILDGYKCLKDEIKADAHYVGLVINHKGRAQHYPNISRALREAAACGFTAPTNSAVNRKLLSSIGEAHYRLGKCNPDKIVKEILNT